MKGQKKREIRTKTAQPREVSGYLQKTEDMDNGCCLACLPLDIVACTLEQPISFTREQFVARCIVQLVYGIMGQSTLCEIQFDSFSL